METGLSDDGFNFLKRVSTICNIISEFNIKVLLLLLHRDDPGNKAEFGDDFREFIQAMNNHDVEYILVGGCAVILHDYRRVTGIIDIWVNRTSSFQ